MKKKTIVVCTMFVVLFMVFTPATSSMHPASTNTENEEIDLEAATEKQCILCQKNYDKQTVRDLGYDPTELTKEELINKIQSEIEKASQEKFNQEAPQPQCIMWLIKLLFKGPICLGVWIIGSYFGISALITCTTNPGSWLCEFYKYMFLDVLWPISEAFNCGLGVPIIP